MFLPASSEATGSNRRQQQVVGFKKRANLVAQRVSLEHFFIIGAHVLRERRIEHFGNRGIEEIALFLHERT